MYNTQFFGLAMIIYLISSLLYIVNLVHRQRQIARIAFWTAFAGLFCHSAALILRTIASFQMGIGQPPFTNLYSSMVFFSWSVVLIYLIFEKKYGYQALGAVVMPIALLILASTALMSNQIEPLVPALQSNWLLIHVVTCFFGYAAFAVAFGVSIMYLVKNYYDGSGGQRGIISLLPSTHVLDELEYKAVAVGFPFLTLGIITGAAWAHYAWGSYWSWDPKETWSLITWFVYAAFLHARFSAGWKGKRTAILSILGFLFVLMTYFGVSFLLGGLHSYA